VTVMSFISNTTKSKNETVMNEENQGGKP